MLDPRIETGDIALCSLNGVNELGFAEFAGRNLCLSGDLFYLLYCHVHSIADSGGLEKGSMPGRASIRIAVP